LTALENLASPPRQEAQAMIAMAPIVANHPKASRWSIAMPPFP
jgi:hypothetical protein